MDLGLKGKSALVTGGAHGIGRAITYALVAEGAFVYYTSRDRDAVNALQGEMRGDAQGIVTDLESYIPPPVDILVNNAGSTLGVQEPYCGTDDLRRVMRLNFEIPRELAHRCLPAMKAKEWGRIVNITSCSGHENRGPVTFCCAKAALTAYTKSMGRVLAIESPGIVMSAVYPGVVFTEGGHWDKVLKERPGHWDAYKKDIPVGRFGAAGEIAAAVAFQCSTQASFSHGCIVGVDGGLRKGYG